MTITRMPSRVLRLAVASLATLLLTFAVILPQADASRPISGGDGSIGCHVPYSPKVPSSWACARLTGPPNQTIVTGVPTKFTLKFRAKRTLKNVTLCISNPNNGRCAYQRKVKLIRKGQTITRSKVITVQPLSGAVASSTSRGTGVTGKGSSKGVVWDDLRPFNVVAKS